MLYATRVSSPTQLSFFISMALLKSFGLCHLKLPDTDRMLIHFTAGTLNSDMLKHVILHMAHKALNTLPHALNVLNAVDVKIIETSQ